MKYRPRTKVVRYELVASFSWKVQLREFKRNLEGIKARIPEGVYFALASCTSKQEIEEKIKVNLGNKYIIELDWLYNQICTQVVVNH